jgi:glycosyltransferase involved in cell wall biosynthesis
MMKKIAIVTGLHLWSLGEKKGAASFYETIKGYTDHGYSVDLITCKRIDGLDPTQVSYHVISFSFLESFIRIKKLGFFFRLLKWLLFQVFCIISLVKLARIDRLHIIYAYEYWGVPAAQIVGKLMKVPVVTRFQGTIMKSCMKKRFWRIRYWVHWIGLRTKADLVIMANDGTQGDQVLKSFGVPDSKVRFWMNGVNTNNTDISDSERKALFSSQKLDGIDNIILTVSRLVQWKRLDRIINAMPKIISKFPNTCLVIIGDGEARTDYETLANENGLIIGRQVYFTGGIEHSKVRRFMSIAQVFVSLYDLSNVGNPLLEALGMGKCIVTLNNGDTGKIIENEVNGILLEQDELDLLPYKICELLLDKNRRNSFETEAKKYAEKNFVPWSERMRKEVIEVEKLITQF